jgi:predicted nucleic acid-binding Zn ribbon protein
VTRRPERDPTPLSDALAEVGSELGLPEPGALAALAARWEEVVGPAVAAHARVAALREGVLTVVVDGAPWATQLRYSEGDVVRVASETVGQGVVRALRVRVEGPA